MVSAVCPKVMNNLNGFKVCKAEQGHFNEGVLYEPHLLSFLTIGTCVFGKIRIFVMITLSF